MTVELRVYPDAPATLGGFAKGDCEAMTTDNSGLFAERLKLEKPGDAVILPEIISKEPLGPVTRADDLRWHTIVKWVAFALINAEELGVSSKTLPPGAAIGQARRAAPHRSRWRTGQDARARRCLEPPRHRSRGQLCRTLRAERRHGFAPGNPAWLEQLWSEGGILYAPPVR